MPIFLIGTGLVLVLLGVNGDAAAFYGLVASDFTSTTTANGNTIQSFIWWALAIIVLGALGYIKGLENLSKLFLILVLIVLFLDNGGFFNQFQAFLQTTTQPPATPASSTTGTPAASSQQTTTPTSSSSSSSNSGSGLGSSLSSGSGSSGSGSSGSGSDPGSGGGSTPVETVAV